MELDRKTLEHVLDIAMSCEMEGKSYQALVSRLSDLLTTEKFRLDVGQMVKTQKGEFVTITKKFDGGYMAQFVGSPKIKILLNENDIDRKGVAS